MLEVHDVEDVFLFYDFYIYLQDEYCRADTFLRREMGLDIKHSMCTQQQLNFTKEEINQYVKRFKSLDFDNKGFITINDLRSYFEVGMDL